VHSISLVDFFVLGWYIALTITRSLLWPSGSIVDYYVDGPMFETVQYYVRKINKLLLRQYGYRLNSQLYILQTMEMFQYLTYINTTILKYVFRVNEPKGKVWNSGGGQRLKGMCYMISYHSNDEL
jgi:hypothetical protein